MTSIRLLDPGAMGAIFKDMRTNPWHPNIISVFPKVLDNPILWTGYLFPFAPTAAALITARAPCRASRPRVPSREVAACRA